MNKKVFVVTKDRDWGRPLVMGVYGNYNTALDEIIQDILDEQYEIWEEVI